MFDLGWSELLVIGVAALIVVGPKDLPRLLRTLGQYTARAKGIAREFQRSMEEAARQADLDELKDVKKTLDDVRDTQYEMQRSMGQSFLDDPAKKPKKKKAPKPAADEPADTATPEAPAPESPAPEAAKAAAKPDPESTSGA